MATKLFTCENSSDYHQSRQTIIPVLGTRGNLLRSTSVKWGNIVSQLKSCVQILALVASRVLQKAHVPWPCVLNARDTNIKRNTNPSVLIIT